MAMMNARLDEALKKNAEAVMKDLGVTPTMCVTHLYKYIAENKRLPFRALEVFRTPEDIFREALYKVETACGMLSDLCGLTVKIESIPEGSFKKFAVNAIEDVSQFIIANRDFMQDFTGQPEDGVGVNYHDASVHWDDILFIFIEARLVIKGTGFHGVLGASLKNVVKKLEDSMDALEKFLS